MGDTKHTPGPWMQYKGDNRIVVAEEDSRLVAVTVDDEWDRASGEPDADARLIAAAPELLEALDRCEAALSAYLIECGPLMTPIDAEEICTAARAAIADERDALRAECERMRAFVAALRADGLDIDDPTTAPVWTGKIHVDGRLVFDLATVADAATETTP